MAIDHLVNGKFVCVSATNSPLMLDTICTSPFGIQRGVGRAVARKPSCEGRSSEVKYVVHQLFEDARTSSRRWLQGGKQCELSRQRWPAAPAAQL